MNNLKINYLNKVAFLFFIFFIYLAITFNLFFLNDEGHLLIFLSCCYFCLMTYIVWDNLITRGAIEITHPVIVYAFLWFIPFALIPLIIAFTKDFFDYLPKSYQYFYKVPHSQVMAIVSLLSIFLGFKFYSKFNNYNKNNKELTSNWNPKCFAFVLILMLFLTILEIIYLIDRNAFILAVNKDFSENKPSITSYILGFFGYDRISIFYLAGPILIGTIYYSKVKNSLLRFVLIILIIFNVLLGFISAQKGRLAALLLVFIFYLYYWNYDKIIKFKNEIKIFILIIFFILMFPVFFTYRAALNLGYEIKGINDISKIINDYSKVIDTNPFNIILNRFDHLNTNLAIIGQTPNYVDYKMGATYLKGLEAFLILVPKSTKSEDFGRFNHSYAREYNLVEPFDHHSGITLPQFSEFYMNFGSLLIPFYMFIIGIFYAFIYKLVISSSLNLRFVGFILYYIWVIDFSALAFSTTMISTIKTFMGLLIFLIFLNFDKIIKKTIK